MEEHLVEYALGTLDPVTTARVRGYLDAHPAARERLALIQRALAPLADDAAAPEPPPDLVHATLARVAEYRCMLPRAPQPSAYQVETRSRRLLRRADWIVAASILLLMGGLATPFLVEQWRDAQRLACANNLRQVWVALSGHADTHAGALPRVEAEGPRAFAGVFVPLLRDSGRLHMASLDCPAQPKRAGTPCTLGELEELYRSDPAAYRRATDRVAGHYAYSLGYRENGRLVGLHRDFGDGLPVVADRASAAENSDNHAGSGQNVLYVGGQVRWCVQPTVGMHLDHIYVNHLNRVNAGICLTDSVLGNSGSRPLPAD